VQAWDIKVKGWDPRGHSTLEKIEMQISFTSATIHITRMSRGNAHARWYTAWAGYWSFPSFSFRTVALPNKLLKRSWTDEDVNFLRVLIAAGAVPRNNVSTSSHDELLAASLERGIREKNLPVVSLLVGTYHQRLNYPYDYVTPSPKDLELAIQVGHRETIMFLWNLLGEHRWRAHGILSWLDKAAQEDEWAKAQLDLHNSKISGRSLPRPE
jgi:hypothetical protein